MSTNWQDEQKLAGQTSIAYDDSSTAYDSSLVNYNGQLTTVWVDESEQS